jgi:hypothetical protein
MTTIDSKLPSVLFTFALAVGSGCGGDDAVQPSETETSGDGDGDGDGDPGDGDGDGDGDPGDGDGDGDGDPGDGDGDGDGDATPPCTWNWEATQMKANGQTHAALDVDVAPNGDFVAVGRIENSTNDAWIGRFGPDGQPLWEHVVDSGGHDYASAVTFDQAGDVIVVGSMHGSSDDDLWIHKRSADGSAGWTVTVTSQFAGDNTPGDVALSPDGSIVVSAAIRAGNQDTDIWVRKLSTADGSEIWTTSYSGDVDQSGFSIDRGGPLAVAADETIYVGGEQGVNFETREGVLLAYSPNGGQPLWTVSPHVNGLAHLHDAAAVAAGPEGEAYFAVVQPGVSEGFWLTRIAATGDIEWQLTEEDFIYGSTDGWTVTGLSSTDTHLTVSGNFVEEEIGQAIYWSNVWVANVGFDGQGQCIESHTWQNAHIIPASTFGYGLGDGPNGSVTVGEIIDGPENYLWVGGFE